MIGKELAEYRQVNLEPEKMRAFRLVRDTYQEVSTAARVPGRRR